MSIERNGLPGKAKEIVAPKPLDVVRVFPWVIAMADRVVADLKAGEEPELVRVLLGQKSDKSKISPLKITPMGGARKSEISEDRLSAAYRETQEESTITLFPYNPKLKEEISPHIYRSKKNYTYYLKPPSDLVLSDEQKESYQNPRRVSLVSLPALPPRIARGHFPNDYKDNLEKIVPLKVSELQQTFKTGEYRGIPIVGHVSKREMGDTIRVSSVDKSKRNSQLDDLVKFLSGVDARIKSDLLAKLHCSHVTTMQEAYEELMHDMGEEVTYKMIRNGLDELRFNLYAEYFRLIEKKTNGLGQNHQNGNGGESDFETNGNTNFSRRAQVLKHTFTHGNYGTEVLHFLPLYSQSEVRKAKTTKSSVAFEGFLIDLFDKCVGLTTQETGDQRWTVDEAKRFYLPNGMPHPAHQRVLLSEKMQRVALEEIGRIYGYSDEYIHEVWHETQRFFPEFGKIVSSEKSELRDKIRQAHELRNEVSGAGIPELIARYFHDPEALIRFEAGRQLFIFLKILFEKERYDGVVDRGSEPFRLAVEDFFGRRDLSRNEVSVNGRPYPLRKGEKYTTLVDQKPIKAFNSYLRVGMAKPADAVHDIFSYSIVLWNEHQDAKNIDGVQKQITMTQSMIDEFIYSLRSRFFPPESNWKVEVFNDKDNTETFKKYKRKGLSQSEFAKLSGERTGSQGDFIVRRKMIVRVSDPGGRSYDCEFAFYPFAQLDQPSAKAGFMGWEEKIQDDSKYTLRRILNPLKGAQGLQSMYELFFPTHFYPFVADWVKKAIAADERLAV